MKSATLRLSLFTLPLLAALSSGVRAQGSLTPPAGPPAPVFKTLNQIEARTPISSVTGDATAIHVIKLPGSYYLTGDVTGGTGKAGIRIEAVNVNIDLNGYALDAVVGSTAGIQTTAPGGPIMVRNGIIRGFANGLDILGATQFVGQDIQVVSPQDTGIKFDGQGILERVTINGGKGNGIEATAISRVKIRDCRIQALTRTTLATGINAEQGVVENCHISGVSGVGSYGISAAKSVTGCTIQAITSSGLGRAVGIQAEFVSDCTIADVSQTGTAGAVGVSNARGASRCNVLNLSGSDATGFLSVQRLTDSDASSLTGTTAVTGIGDCATVHNCRASGLISASGMITGISLPARARATENVVSLGAGTGMLLRDYCVASGNTVGLPLGTGTGISGATPVTGVRIEGNHVSGGATGLLANDTSAVVVRNTVAGATTHYTVHAGVSVANSTAPGTNPFTNLRQ